jgi:hypothetical protein
MYASGKYAIAMCDICARQIDYTSLKKYIYNQRWNGLLVCEECFDIDNPQLQIGKYVKTESIALQNPRTASQQNPPTREYFGWNPVLPNQIYVTLGSVKVSIS